MAKKLGKNNRPSRPTKKQNKYEISLGPINPNEGSLLQKAVETHQNLKDKRLYSDGSIIPRDLPESYELGKSPKECANCIWFNKNNCNKYASNVRGNHVCDTFSWVNTNKTKARNDWVNPGTSGGGGGGNDFDQYDFYLGGMQAPDSPQKMIKQHRFFDDVLNEKYKTITGNNAKFATSANGTITDWSGRKVKIGLELVFKDGSKVLEDQVIALIKNIKTTRNSEMAQITLESIVQPMMDADAGKIKDGFDWYKNRPLSFLFNELLKLVYGDKEGNLPLSKQINGEALEVGTSDGNPLWFDMGLPNSWDGTTFTEVIGNINVTAMCQGQAGIYDTSHRMYVAIGGADYPPASSEIYSVDAKTNLWTFLAKYSSPNARRIKRLHYNERDNTLYGYAHCDDINKSTDIWGTDSAGQTQTSVKALFPEIDIIHFKPGISSGDIDGPLNRTILSYGYTGKTIIREGMDPQYNKYDFVDAEKLLGSYYTQPGSEAINGFGDFQAQGPTWHTWYGAKETAQMRTYNSLDQWRMWGENTHTFGIGTNWLNKYAVGFENVTNMGYVDQERMASYKVLGPYGGPQFRNLESMFTGPNNGHNWCGLFSQIGGWKGTRYAIDNGYGDDWHQAYYWGNDDPMQSLTNQGPNGNDGWRTPADPNGPYWGNFGNFFYRTTNAGNMMPGDYINRQGGENVAVGTMGKQVFFGGMSPYSVKYHRNMNQYDTNLNDNTDTIIANSPGGRWNADARDGAGEWDTRGPTSLTSRQGLWINSSYQYTRRLYNTVSNSPRFIRDMLPSPGFDANSANNNLWWYLVEGGDNGSPIMGTCYDPVNVGHYENLPSVKNAGNPAGLSNPTFGEGVNSHLFNINMIGADPNDYCAPLADGTKVVHGLFGQIARHTWGLRADQSLGQNPKVFSGPWWSGGVEYDWTPNQTQWKKLSGLGDTSLWGYADPAYHPEMGSFHKYYGMAGPFGAFPWVVNISPWQIPELSFTGTGVQATIDSLANYSPSIMNVDEDRHRTGAGGVGWLSAELENPRTVHFETGHAQGNMGGWLNNRPWKSYWDDVEGRGYNGSDIPTRFNQNVLYSNNQQGIAGVYIEGYGNKGGYMFATADSTYGGYIDHTWVDIDCASGNQMVSGPWRKNSYELGYVVLDCETKELEIMHNMAGPTNINYANCWSAIKHNDIANDFSTRQPSAAVGGEGADSNKLYLATTTYDSYTLAYGAKDHGYFYVDENKQVGILRNMWGINYSGYGCSGTYNTICDQADLTTSFFFNADDNSGDNAWRTIMSMGIGGQDAARFNNGEFNHLSDSVYQNLALHVSLVSDTSSNGTYYIAAGHSSRYIKREDDTWNNDNRPGGGDYTDHAFWPVSFVWTSTPITDETNYHIGVTRELQTHFHAETTAVYQLYINGIWQDSTVGYSISGYNWTVPNPDSAGQIAIGHATAGWGDTTAEVNFFGTTRFAEVSLPAQRHTSGLPWPRVWRAGYYGENSIGLQWGGMKYGFMCETLDRNKYIPITYDNDTWELYDESYGGMSYFMTGEGEMGEMMQPRDYKANRSQASSLSPGGVDHAPKNRLNFSGYMWLCGIWNYKMPYERGQNETGQEIDSTLHENYVETILDMYNEGRGKTTTYKWWNMDTFIPVYANSRSDYGPQQACNTSGEGDWQDSMCLSFLRNREPACQGSNRDKWSSPVEVTERWDAWNMNGADEFGNPIGDSGSVWNQWDWSRDTYTNYWNGNARFLDVTGLLPSGGEVTNSTGEHNSDVCILAKTEIHEIDFGNSPQFPTIYTKYESVIGGDVEGGDNSIYASNFGAPMNDYPNKGLSAKNKSRSILWLNYNNGLNHKLQGWSMRRDNILTNDILNGYYDPCNEVFTYDPDNGDINQLTIVDIDMPGGQIADATGFCPFMNPTIDPSFQSQDSSARVYYFRISDPNDGAGNEYYYVSNPVKLQYIENNSNGSDVGSNYWDDDPARAITSAYLSVSPNDDESFTSNQQAVVVQKDSTKAGTLIEGIWFGSSHWYNTENVLSDYVTGIPAFGLSAWKNPSSARMYQLTRTQYDPIIALADFSDMKVYDGISKLAGAYNLMFGMDLEEAFIVKRKTHSGTADHTIDWRTGEILDMEKTVGDDIRNVLVGIPYEEQVDNPKWEIVMDSNSPEEGAFEGNLDVVTGNETIKMGMRTSKTVMLCDKSGWLDGEYFVGSNMDYGTTAGDPKPYFKFLTSSASHDAFLTKPIVDYDTATHQTLYLSSIYKGGGDQISSGDLIVIATDTDTSVGNIYTAHVESVDQTYATITTQYTGFPDNPFGFTGLNAAEGTAVQISEQQSTGGGSVFENYDLATQSFSNDGVAVLTADATWHADCGTILTVSNPKSFAPAQVFSTNPAGTESPVMLISKYNTDWLRSYFGDPIDTLAAGHQYGNSTVPFGYVHKVDFSTRKILIKPNPFDLNGNVDATTDISHLFSKGDKIAAWVFFPFDETRVPLASHHYKIGWSAKDFDPEAADQAIDTFVQQNTRFKITTTGPKLVLNAKKTFTYGNQASINRFGKKDYKLPANRFRNRFWMPIVLGEMLEEYAFPKYELIIKTLYKPNISFVSSNKFALNKVKVIDEIMFPSSPGYSMEGWIKEYTINMKSLEITLKLRSSNRV